MALIGAICSQNPYAQLSIIFLPFVTFSVTKVRSTRQLIDQVRSFSGFDFDIGRWSVEGEGQTRRIDR
jgi:hypothetical protein